MILRPFHCETEEIRTEKRCEEKYNEIFYDEDDDDDCHNRDYSLGKYPSHDVLFYKIAHSEWLFK